MSETTTKARPGLVELSLTRREQVALELLKILMGSAPSGIADSICKQMSLRAFSMADKFLKASKAPRDSMQVAVLYALVTPTLYYLGSQALITQWLWGKYPRRLDAFMSCAACSGMWYGVAISMIGWWLRLPFLGLAPRHWLTPILVGLCSSFWTPILARKMLDSLYGPAE